MSDIEQVVRQHIIEEFMSDDANAELTNDQELIKGGLVDSLGIFLLVAFVQERFGVTIEPAEVVLDNFETVNAICELVRAKQPAS